MDSGISQAIPLSDDEELLVESVKDAAIPDGLFELNELGVLYDDRTAALWTFMNPEGRPSFTPPMLHDFERWQELIPTGFGEGKVPLRYLILGSRAQDVFCFGGDLALFEQLIRNRDREGLVQYGHRCCTILDRNIKSLDIPMLTIGLFPGMGAHALLYRKLGSARAEQIILSNETYTAEQMFELGLVHELAEPGDGINACKQFIKKSERRHAWLVGSRKAMKHAWNLKLGELNKITEMWADTALELREQDLKVMNRLVAAQGRLAERIAPA